MRDNYLQSYYVVIDATLDRGTVEVRKRVLNDFFSHFDVVTETSIAEFIKLCESKGNSRNTIHLKIGVLRLYIEYAGEHGEENITPLLSMCKRYRPEVKLKDSVNMEEVETLLSWTKELKYRTLIALQAFGGLRVGEALKLRRSDDNGNWLHIRDPKNNRERRAWIENEELRNLLDEWEKERETMAAYGDNDLLFPMVKRNSYQVFVGRLGKRLGIKVHTHTFRRFFVTHCVEQGLPLTSIAKQVGHATIATTQLYVDDTPALQEQMKNIWKVGA